MTTNNKQKEPMLELNKKNYELISAICCIIGIGAIVVGFALLLLACSSFFRQTPQKPLPTSFEESVEKNEIEQYHYSMDREIKFPEDIIGY